MSFHNRRTHILVQRLVTFNKMTVYYTVEIKFLVTQVMDTLLIYSILCKVAFMIKSLKVVLSSNLIRNIYFTKFHSLLRFGILFWGRRE